MLHAFTPCPVPRCRRQRSHPTAHAENATLTVTLKNVRDASGALRAGLYREPATFRKEEKAVEVARHPPRPAK